MQLERSNIEFFRMSFFQENVLIEDWLVSLLVPGSGGFYVKSKCTAFFCDEGFFDKPESTAFLRMTGLHCG